MTSHSLHSMQPSTRFQIGPLVQPDRQPRPSRFRDAKQGSRQLESATLTDLMS